MRDSVFAWLREKFGAVIHIVLLRNLTQVNPSFHESRAVGLLAGECVDDAGRLRSRLSEVSGNYSQTINIPWDPSIDILAFGA